jgi:RimJ/RimL family protein N-acetyltransferase
MTPDGQLFKRLASRLPDIPRWIEPRSMLLSGTCQLFGLDEEKLEFACFNPYTRVGSVVGRPPAEAIRHVADMLAAADEDLLVYDDNLEYVHSLLPQWEASPATLHLLADSSKLPTLEPLGPGGMHARPFTPPEELPTLYDYADQNIVIRFISGGELTEIEWASAQTLAEIQRAALIGKLAATFVDDKPVSFCDAGTQTESLWDIGIDTLEEHRRQGYAALCVAYMIDQMGRLGKRPVWGAEESNLASMRLAAKLGFKPVDRIVVLVPPD